MSDKPTLTLLVAGEYPDLHLCQREVRDGLRHTILQLVLDGAGANQRQILLDLVVDAGQPRFTISHRDTDIIRQIKLILS